MPDDMPSAAPRALAPRQNSPPKKAGPNWAIAANDISPIDDSRVLRRFVYRHPLYTPEAIRAQREWSDVSGVNRTHYCGAYWRYGFHEDGLHSALRVAGTLGVAW